MYSTRTGLQHRNCTVQYKLFYKNIIYIMLPLHHDGSSGLRLCCGVSISSCTTLGLLSLLELSRRELLVVVTEEGEVAEADAAVDDEGRCFRDDGVLKDALLPGEPMEPIDIVLSLRR